MNFITQLGVRLANTVFSTKESLCNELLYENESNVPPYPNLWYPVIQSRILRQGQVKPLCVLGKNLVAYRALSGKVYVLDAFCPHLGAHLGIGGSVVGEDIRCPFHSWTFNGQGVCTKVPGLPDVKSIPTKLKSWKCVEMNDWVYIWYHDKDQGPQWLPLKFEELSNGQYSGQVQSLQHGHLVDILSNTADLDHFDVLHSMAGLVSAWEVLRKGKFYYFMRKILFIDFQVSWQIEMDKHIAYAQATNTPVLLGIPLKIFQIITTIKFCPPVYYIVSTITKLNLSFYLVSALIPISPMKNLFVHNVYYSKGFFSKIFAKMGLYAVLPSTEPDKIILNNKRFMDNPCFTSLDKDLVRFNHWFKENFFSRDNLKQTSLESFLLQKRL